MLEVQPIPFTVTDQQVAGEIDFEQCDPILRPFSPQIKAKAVSCGKEHVMVLSTVGTVYTKGIGRWEKIARNIVSIGCGVTSVIVLVAVSWVTTTWKRVRVWRSCQRWNHSVLSASRLEAGTRQQWAVRYTGYIRVTVSVVVFIVTCVIGDRHRWRVRVGLEREWPTRTSQSNCNDLDRSGDCQRAVHTSSPWPSQAERRGSERNTCQLRFATHSCRHWERFAAHVRLEQVRSAVSRRLHQSRQFHYMQVLWGSKPACCRCEMRWMVDCRARYKILNTFSQFIATKQKHFSVII